MGILSQKGLESLLEPLKNKIDNFMPKTGGKFTGPISIGNENNTSTISVEDSYARITSGNTKMDITNNGDILINSKNIFEKDDSLKLGKIVNSNPESNIIEAYQRNRPTPYMFFNGSAVAIGTDIYILGTQYTDSESTHPYAEYNYKYDTITDTYTKNADIPYNFYNRSAVSIDNDIYLLGSGNSDYNKYNYKYDTTTNTYTKNKDIPYSFFSGSAVAIGTDIYLLGNNKYNYKYDTTTNTYTKNTDIPYSFNYGSAVSIGNNIYLLGSYSGSYSKYNYKYDTTTDTYSKMSDIPYNFIEGSAVSIGNNIYLLGSTSYNTSNNFDYRQNNYKYDTTTDTYIRCKNLPYKFHRGSAIAINNSIYIIGNGYCDYDATDDYSKYPYANYNYKYNVDYTLDDSYTRLVYTPYKFHNGSAVAIGNIIYLLGSGYTEGSTLPYAHYNYRYDITNHIYTQMEYIPYYFYNGSAVAIGNDIYLLGSSNSLGSSFAKYKRYNYKYDTTTNTYTKNTDIPYEFCSGSAVVIGNIIYLLGSESGDYSSHPYRKYNYKYDTTTDTYTKNKDIPHDFVSYGNGTAVAIGTDIYLLGNNYKYDTISDSYTEINSAPYCGFSVGVALATKGNSIYLLGGHHNYDEYERYNYKYDIITNTTSIRTDIPYDFYDGSAVAVGNSIYLFGGLYSSTTSYRYDINNIEDTANSSTYIIKPTNHSIYTSNNKSYTTQNASIIGISDNEYYTEYNENNIVVSNTYPIGTDGTVKVYVVDGGVLNGKELTGSGWTTINILDYM